MQYNLGYSIQEPKLQLKKTGFYFKLIFCRRNVFPFFRSEGGTCSWEYPLLFKPTNLPHTHYPLQTRFYPNLCSPPKSSAKSLYLNFNERLKTKIPLISHLF